MGVRYRLILTADSLWQFRERRIILLNKYEGRGVPRFGGLVPLSCFCRSVCTPGPQEFPDAIQRAPMDFKDEAGLIPLINQSRASTLITSEPLLPTVSSHFKEAEGVGLSPMKLIYPTHNCWNPPGRFQLPSPAHRTSPPSAGEAARARPGARTLLVIGNCGICSGRS
jgi:hypothetical protein